MTIAFGVSLALVVAGMGLSSLRGNRVTRDTVAWAITGVVFYALFFWPGWIRGV
jgi:hypothetical protein